MSKLKVGDKVAFSVQWLHSIQAITGELPAMRGVITGFQKVSDTFTLALVTWNDGEEQKINVKNLAKVGPNARFCQC